MESVNLEFAVDPETVGVGFTVSAMISGLLVTTGLFAQGWAKGLDGSVGTIPGHKEQTFSQIHFPASKHRHHDIIASKVYVTQ